MKNHPEHIWVTAHRGAHQKYPENTLASMREAIRMNVDIIEIDVRETKDHELVLIHDETIDRVTGENGYVKDLTLKEIQKKNLLFKGEQTNYNIPTFSEALDELKGKAIINIDFKAGYEEALSKACLLIKEKGMEQEAFIYIYNHYEIITCLQKKYPWINIWPRAYSREDINTILTFSNIKIIQIDFSFYDDDWTKKLIKQGIRVSANALGKYDDMQRQNVNGFEEIIKKQVNVIETDLPEELVWFLKNKGLRL
ncbi:MAG: glycerophosphodiester phosphodiesterase family protein [Massilibacteroides sp.]|nr:glycerophosphodiester phosphodiesterase family protein [Massilibacteroides sp.]MDD4116071.1 glycerophosphodiester phosphodiesterase family protein [Massilibacteroides sp.]MDD4661206.1 glycerophosphodiester phosphodiesterase family protein [Massilibacteroides sp.]